MTCDSDHVNREPVLFFNWRTKRRDSNFTVRQTCYVSTASMEAFARRIADSRLFVDATKRFP